MNPPGATRATLIPTQRPALTRMYVNEGKPSGLVLENVTNEMTAGGGAPIDLNAGQQGKITVRITVKPFARIGTIRSASVAASWSSEVIHADLVKARVHVVS